MTQLLRNSIITPDGTELVSRNRHDFVEHTDSLTGHTYFVDGGLDYCRIGGADDYINNCTTSDQHHGHIRETFEWGSYGVGGTEPLCYIVLKQMSTQHIEAIINTQTHISEEMVRVFKDELEWREA